MADLTLDINKDVEAWQNGVPDIETRIALTFKKVLATVDLSDQAAVEVSLLLTDDAHQQALNLRWRGLDQPTNVLSFPAGDEPTSPDQALLLGDISLAYETVAAEAQDQQKTFDDHVSHLLVHGLLHLLGFDHDSDADAEEMETLEIEILQGLGISSPYTS